MVSTEAIETATTANTNIAFKNVLCATDFSEISKNALAYAAAIARSHAATLYILHVLPDEARMSIPVEPLPADLDRERLEAVLNMEIFAKQKCLNGLECETIVERGSMEDVVADVLSRKEIDLLVLGTHGRNGLNKFLLGSVAEDLFRIAECPVLTIGAQVPDPPQNGVGIRTVLFPTDFGPQSLAALPYVLSMAKEDVRHLILLHVVTPQTVSPNLSWEGLITVSEKRQLETLDATRRMHALIPDDTQANRDIQ